MSLHKAIQFVNQVGKNADLRARCITYGSRDLLMKEFDFTEPEFDNAINMQLVKCQTEDQAAKYHQLRMWFMLL